jgi:hypothetical protein
LRDEYRSQIPQLLCVHLRDLSRQLHGFDGATY